MAIVVGSTLQECMCMCMAMEMASASIVVSHISEVDVALHHHQASVKHRVGKQLIIYNEEL
jgi:hypothetical protein